MKPFQISIALLCLGLLAGCGGGNSGSGGGAPAVLQSIQITPLAPSIPAGLVQQFTATGKYSDNTSKDLTRSATWSSSDTNAATVSSAGAATTTAPGSTTIAAAFSGISGSTTLTVTAPAVASIAVSPGSASIPLGTTVQFTAMGTYTDGSKQELTNSSIWSSSNTSTATVSSSGLATSQAAGSTTITASSSGFTGGASLTVTPAALVSIEVSPASASIAPGTTMQFSARGTFTDGSIQNITSSVTWASENPSVASINLNGVPGLAKGLAPGSSTITATSGSLSSSGTLTVTSASLLSIAVTPANVSIPLGTLQQFTATGTFSDQTTQDITGTVAWSSSNNSIASITVSGLVTARNLGSVTIKATSGSISGNTTATVNAADLSSLAILPGDTTIAQSTSQQFSAIGTFTDGSTHDLSSESSWTSSNSAVAKIGASGLARALSPGTTTLTATLGPVSASVTLVVTNATIVSISVTPVGRTIAPSTKLSFTATGLFSDSTSQVVTRDATWASDNPAVATVAPVSVVTAVAPGTANISATFNGVSGSAPLYVSSVTLSSIAVSPASAVLAPASTLGYAATGTFSDGSTQTITSAVTWSSSAPDVASISNFGQVTGQSPGIATITAQLGSVTGTADLVVESSSLIAVQVTPTSATVAQQTGVLFHATGIFADGSAQDLSASVSWSSSPASVATISNATGTKGLATGMAPGTATITALFAGEVGTASLTVTDATLTSLTVAPSSASIALGDSQQFTATGNFSDGTTENLTRQATWTSSNVNVATITATGLATSAGTGTTTITATINGVSETAVLTVH